MSSGSSSESSIWLRMRVGDEYGSLRPRELARPCESPRTCVLAGRADAEGW